jgi:hypothetical protein
MSTLWLGKEIRPELDVFAFAETERVGQKITRARLAREIFKWGFEQFRKAGGNLKRLKSARLVFPEQTISEAELWDRIGARGQK